MKARYGVTTEELLVQAVKNSMERYPAQVSDLESVMQKMLGISTEDMSPSFTADMGIGNGGLFILSNKENLRGAGVLFYPGVLDQISAMCPDGFYLIPSSVHEVLIFPKNDNFTDREIDEIIENVNIFARKNMIQDLFHMLEILKEKFVDKAAALSIIKVK